MGPHKRPSNAWWWAFAYALLGCVVYAGYRYVCRTVAQRELQARLAIEAKARKAVDADEPRRLERALHLCVQYLRAHPNGAPDPGLSVISSWAERRGLASHEDFCSRRDNAPYRLECKGRQVTLRESRFGNTAYK
jgi:hypothetical protein